MLTISDLSLTFPEGKGEVFRCVDLHIKSGEIVLLTGPSGVGKSALLQCIAGVIPEIFEGMLEGAIDFEACSLRGKKTCEIAGDIAYMFQDADSQLCTFTVEDELAFGLENLKWSQDRMAARIDELLELLEIEHLKHRRVNTLSGGEKQKVALAALLVMGPRMILMDEPTANLDPAATEQMASLIQTLKNRFGMTFLLIEHKVGTFAHVADRIVRMTEQGIHEISREQVLFEYQEFIQQLGSSSSSLASTKKPVLQVENLSFAFPGHAPCLQHLNLTVHEGEILAVAGANGAGKSTLSRLMMGLLRPEAGKGQIHVLGRPLQSYKPRELGQNVGYVFQNPEHQFIKGTVEAELALSLKTAGIEGEEAQRRTENYLKLFHLCEHRTANPFMLSQGQKRRLSAASMLISGQPLLILDEPTYGQDLDNLLELVALLRDVRRGGVTIVMITHDMDLMRSVADRVAILNRGQFVHQGPFDEVLLQKWLLKGGHTCEN